MAEVQDANVLPRAATPESVGVSSRAVLNLLDEFDKQGLEYHGLMILRHGQVAYEIFRRPYAPDIPHNIYSFSKSIAATAAGFAIDEGLFRLDSRISELFPEYQPTRAAGFKQQYIDRWNAVTVRHIITMTSGLAFDVFHQNSSPDWVKDYLHSKLRDEPGTKFHYTNECAYLISALVTKLTGQTMFEYLTPRFFQPLGIAVPYSETDAQGRQAGGWGIYWTLEDSAKFTQVYLNNGKWNGVQVLPEWWAKEATSALVSNADNFKRDSRAGYGYQFWQCSLPNTYASRGMFCQQGIGMRDYDAVFVFFGADADEQKPYDVIYPHFPSGFVDDGAEVDEAALELIHTRAATLSFPEPPVSPRYAEKEAALQNSTLKLRHQLILNLTSYPQSFLPMTVNQMAVDRAGNINNIRLSFSENELQFSWTEGKDARWKNSVPLGLDGGYRVGHVSLSGFELETRGYAHWLDENTLFLSIRPMESGCNRTFRITFRGKCVRVQPGGTPEFVAIANNLAKLSKQYLGGSNFLHFWSRQIFKIAPKILESAIRGQVIVNSE
ncbi:MAG: beta-lactamase family protein [Oscillospiraceae bacterium]|jgi:CubicO group peptidase (beta-lactamase class C family)|nr:beta-lactamase family protein [Oscillospiraceae bacterium]